MRIPLRIKLYTTYRLTQLREATNLALLLISFCVEAFCHHMYFREVVIANYLKHDDCNNYPHDYPPALVCALLFNAIINRCAKVQL